MSADIPNPPSDRPLGERIREFRYRFAQTFVFGVPVLALQWFGPKLGGPEAPRFIAIFQAILSAWILYVAAAGLLYGGLLSGAWLDVIAAVLAMGVFVFSLVFITTRPPMFHDLVVLLLFWTGIRWWQLWRQSRFSPDL